jgi:gamma-glutamyl-gamma-aminobutyrate hydrolase PuuD
MPKVYIVGGDKLIEAMFKKRKWEVVRILADADLCVFTGGHDVNPKLYGEIALACTHYSKLRDDFETEQYYETLGADIPMVGICRGGQFLNVMNGGKMWQDVNNHTSPHDLMDLDSKELIRVTSTHHQMMRPSHEAITLAVAKEATEKVSPSHFARNASNHWEDAEVVFYPKTKSLCFQPHPEYSGCPDCTDYFFELIGRLDLVLMEEAE